MPGRSSGATWIVVGCLYGAVALGFLLTASYDVSGGLILLPVLLAITIPLITRAARREGDNRLVRILTLAALTKLILGTIARYGALEAFYGGPVDAGVYHQYGSQIAHAFRSGDFSVDLGGGGDGTQTLRLITGIIYTITGSTELGGFLVFSWIAFLGLFFFFRAYRIALPSWPYHRYAILLFFLPTLVFWPSSIGKEAWLVFALGLATNGAARLFARRHGGFIVLAMGLLAIAIIRPHMAVIVFVAVAIGYLLRRAPRGSGLLLPAKLMGLAVLLVIGSLVAGRFADYFGVDDIDRDSVTSVLDETSRRTTQGGSEFQPVDAVRNPILAPLAVVTVVMRPLPHEANNTQALVTAVEANFVGLLLLVSRRRVFTALRESLGTAYLAFAVTYVLAFSVAFASIGNFGILARQRAQLYPLVLVFLCAPHVHALTGAARQRIRWVRGASPADAGQLRVSGR